MSRGADEIRSRLMEGLLWGFVIRAYNPTYHVKSFLYTFNAYSGIILSFLITLDVTNYSISVCFIYCIINKSLGYIIISYLFIFFNIYITISYCLYHV